MGFHHCFNPLRKMSDSVTKSIESQKKEEKPKRINHFQKLFIYHLKKSPLMKMIIIVLMKVKKKIIIISIIVRKKKKKMMMMRMMIRMMIM